MPTSTSRTTSWNGWVEAVTRVLGIDPGTTVTGWGVVEPNGAGFRHVAHGSIRTSADTPLPVRLHKIFAGLVEVIRLHRPQEASIEEVFVSVNAQSALKLGHARGCAIVAVASHGLPVFEYGALQIKKATVGFGKAEKHQVQAMVKLLLALPEPPPKDAADALAGALCHLQHTSGSRRPS
ncbi:MAG: crossover junction endodeoxyribonuclease RuvC [Magnetococcales bacterium]|nr:crossover junction endodeoxyribonuclease RuvC [Magnetococcales bacterium]